MREEVGDTAANDEAGEVDICARNNRNDRRISHVDVRQPTNAAGMIDGVAAVGRRSHATGADRMRVVRDVVADEPHQARRGREPSWSSLDRIREWCLACQVVNEPHPFDECVQIVLRGIAQQTRIDRRRLTGIRTRETDAAARSGFQIIREDAKGQFASPKLAEGSCARLPSRSSPKARSLVPKAIEGWLANRSSRGRWQT